MKTLNYQQMETISAGLKISTLAGILCGSAVVLACSGVLAPLAAAPAVGCATTLAAMEYWESQGLNYE